MTEMSFPQVSIEPLTLTEDHLRSVLIVRRARAAIFGENLFSDPAWDILLELFAARLGRRSMSASELALAIESPPSTTLRWIAVLHDRGLVECARGAVGTLHPTLSLSTEGASKMERLAGQWGAAFVAIR